MAQALTVFHEFSLNCWGIDWLSLVRDTSLRMFPLKRNESAQVFSGSYYCDVHTLVHIRMESFSEVGERAMKALVEAIRSELVSRKQVHVDALGTFRVVEAPAHCVHETQQTTLTPPTRHIAFEADGPTEQDDG